MNVPFSGHAGAKPRPALVLSTDAFHRKLPDLIVCPISSQPRFYNAAGRWRSSSAVLEGVGLASSQHGSAFESYGD